MTWEIYILLQVLQPVIWSYLKHGHCQMASAHNQLQNTHSILGMQPPDPIQLYLNLLSLKNCMSLSSFSQFVPDAESSGNHSEMFMFTAVKNNEAIFCDHLNVSRTWHSIYENNKASLNSAGYFSGLLRLSPKQSLCIRY